MEERAEEGFRNLQLDLEKIAGQLTWLINAHLYGEDRTGFLQASSLLRNLRSFLVVRCQLPPKKHVAV